MFRSLLRFSIRDVLWLTVVVGLSPGWWIEKRRSRHCHEDLLAAKSDLDMAEMNKRAWELTVDTYGIERPSAYIEGRGYVLLWKPDETDPPISEPALFT